jgi:hypothetical protein
MKTLNLVVVLLLATSVASADQDAYINCANQHNEIVALSREAGEFNKHYQNEAGKVSSSSGYLQSLEDQLYKKDHEISLLGNKFDQECLKALLKK